MAAPSSVTPVMPQTPIRFGPARLGYRWTRYLGWCASHRHLEGARDALRGMARLTHLVCSDSLHRRPAVVCNLCGWSGCSFYPNVGPGYFEADVSCPHCACIHRYRSLAVVLQAETDLFAPETQVIEVAPVRSFQAYCLWRKGGRNYRSFDLARFAMERGDLTAMHYGDASCDYFLCYHVLEHVPADRQALAEIYRVLRPGGVAILQVPIDWQLDQTEEYGAPRARETGHVRRYSHRGFRERLEEAGFSVRETSAGRHCTPDVVRRHHLCREPIFMAAK